jgi:hypothetical protein
MMQNSDIEKQQQASTYSVTYAGEGAPYTVTVQSTETNSNDPYDEFPIPIRWIVKIAVIILGAIGILLGFLTCITLEFVCVMAGILLMYSSFLLHL